MTAFLKSLPRAFYSPAFYRTLAKSQNFSARPFILVTAALLALTALLGTDGVASGIRAAFQKFGELSGMMQILVGVGGDVDAAAVWGGLTGFFTGAGSIFAGLGIIFLILAAIVLFSAALTFLSAVVVSLLSAIFNISFDFRAAFRLAAAALVPSILASLLLPAGVGCVWLGYLSFAVWSNRTLQEKTS